MSHILRDVWEDSVPKQIVGINSTFIFSYDDVVHSKYAGNKYFYERKDIKYPYFDRFIICSLSAKKTELKVHLHIYREGLELSIESKSPLYSIEDAVKSGVGEYERVLRHINSFTLHPEWKGV